STKRILAVLFFCGFALPTDCEKTCEKSMLEGVTCLIKSPDKSGKVVVDEKWSFTSSSSSFVVQRKNGKDVKTFPNATIESDGSLKLHHVTVSNTGKYTFEAYDTKDEMVANHKEEITVYAKAPNPTVTHKCENGSVRLTCDTQKNDKTDLTITWIRGTEDIKGANKAILVQTSQQLQENTEYSCRVSNILSNAQSDVLTVSCGTPCTLFGYDCSIMVGILSGGGALLLLLIFLFVICACLGCKQREKDEEELRLRSFDTSPTNQQRAKVTARGQPAPPIPQEDSYPATQTPPQTQSQTKGLVRARPPPPPQDEDEEDPPPLPRPRKKREKRAEEPYRPME
ncbi:putative T-cell surface antigen CD2, partial [Triplophysa rosa]